MQDPKKFAKETCDAFPYRWKKHCSRLRTRNKDQDVLVGAPLISELHVRKTHTVETVERFEARRNNQLGFKLPGEG